MERERTRRRVAIRRDRSTDTRYSRIIVAAGYRDVRFSSLRNRASRGTAGLIRDDSAQRRRRRRQRRCEDKGREERKRRRGAETKLNGCGGGGEKARVIVLSYLHAFRTPNHDYRATLSATTTTNFNLLLFAALQRLLRKPGECESKSPSISRALNAIDTRGYSSLFRERRLKFEQVREFRFRSRSRVGLSAISTRAVIPHFSDLPRVSRAPIKMSKGRWISSRRRIGSLAEVRGRKGGI